MVAVPPGTAMTVRSPEMFPAPVVATWTSTEQLAPIASGPRQPLAAIEKSVPPCVIAGTGAPLGEPPTLVTVTVRVSPPICGTPKSRVAGETEITAGGAVRRLHFRFLPWCLRLHFLLA